MTDEAKLLLESLKGFTPGPWEAYTLAGDWGLESSRVVFPQGSDPYDYTTAICHCSYMQPYPAGSSSKELKRADEQQLNAALIAAAPDLHRHLSDALARAEKAENALADRTAELEAEVADAEDRANAFATKEMHTEKKARTARADALREAATIVRERGVNSPNFEHLSLSNAILDLIDEGKSK